MMSGKSEIPSGQRQPAKGLSVFAKYLTLWVIVCIAGGIVLGKLAPGLARSLDNMAIYAHGVPVVSIPIAVCLFFMMYPIMVKIDFAEVIKAGKSFKPVALTLVINWMVKPFTMYAISLLFLGTLFHGLIGPDEKDYVKMPLGMHDVAVGSPHGAGTVVWYDREADEVVAGLESAVANFKKSFIVDEG